MGFLGFVVIFCMINQTKVLTGIGGMSSSWGSGEAEMHPKRKIREYNFILSLLAGLIPLLELEKDWRMWRAAELIHLGLDAHT